MDFGLTETMIKKIGWHLRHFPQVETAILFGSRGKGNFREDSDIDLALKGDGITDDMLHDILQTLSKTTVPYKFDLVIPTSFIPLPNAIFKNLTLFTQQPFIHHKFSDLHIRVSI